MPDEEIPEIPKHATVKYEQKKPVPEPLKDPFYNCDFDYEHGELRVTKTYWREGTGTLQSQHISTVDVTEKYYEWLKTQPTIHVVTYTWIED